MLAAIVKTPELALDQEEAKTLGAAAANVAQHYDFEASEKAIAWTNLTIALGMVYVPRLVAIANKPKARPPQAPVSAPAVKPAGAGQNIVNYPGIGPIDVSGGMPI